MKPAFCCLALMASLACVGARVEAANTVIPSRIDTLARDMTASQTPPAMLVVMIAEGRAAVRGYGKLPGGHAPDARTVFEIGSITKTFTALALAHDVQRGALSLDTPVAELLPSMSVPSRHGKPITLGLLAEQYSGLPSVPANLGATGMRDPYAGYDVDKLRAFLADYALPRDPGDRYQYSNLGFGLLGLALAANDGGTYAGLLRNRVFEPLGMHDSATTLDAARKTRLAPGHDRDGKPTGRWHWCDAMAGAGAVLSDGHDMRIYLEANMGARATPLRAAMALAHKPRRAAGQLGRIGLAWMTTPTPDGDVVWHNGSTGGYASFIGLRSDGDRGVVILANGAAATDTVTGLGLAALAPALPLPKLVADEALPDPVTLPVSVLEGYVGRYTLAPNFVLTVSRRDGQLFARATGQDAFPLFASAKDTFFARVGGIRIDFKRTDDDKVAALILHQNGSAREAPRQADD